MRIGLDAKRAFQNRSGLGNYSRNLIKGLSGIQDNDFEFYLFTTQTKGDLLDSDSLPNNFRTIKSTTLIKPYWRSFSISKDIQKNEIDIFHGLSNELPFTLKNEKIKTVVTIHDILYLKLPSLYPILDRNIYAHKAKKACSIADRVIATSEATKNDLIEFLNVDASKIEVVYQSCDETFYKKYSNAEKEDVKKQFKLPEKFILSVGTLEVRKNHKLIIDAMEQVSPKKRLPIVLIGRDKSELKNLIKRAKKRKIDCTILTDVPNAFLPIIYQCATLFIYPSIYEGYGIPVLEAMASRVPILTTEKTSMEEIITCNDCLIQHNNQVLLAEKIEQKLSENNAVSIERNYKRALDLSNIHFTEKIVNLYKNL